VTQSAQILLHSTKVQSVKEHNISDSAKKLNYKKYFGSENQPLCFQRKRKISEFNPFIVFFEGEYIPFQKN
jgi:hypothetical protein